MKIFKLALLLLLFLPISANAKSASDTAADYYTILAQKNYEGAAKFFDPAALKEFRKMMDFINEIPDQSAQGFYTAFFGPGSTKQSITALSDLEYFASFLRAIMSQAEAAGTLNFDGMEILGEVKEGKSVSHVVTRNKVSVGNIEIEAMEVISMKNNGDTWNVLLSGKMKGVATQLRSAFNRPNSEKARMEELRRQQVEK